MKYVYEIFIQGYDLVVIWGQITDNEWIISARKVSALLAKNTTHITVNNQIKIRFTVSSINDII
jgi:hypothetical protein